MCDVPLVCRLVVCACRAAGGVSSEPSLPCCESCVVQLSRCTVTAVEDLLKFLALRSGLVSHLRLLLQEVGKAMRKCFSYFSPCACPRIPAAHLRQKCSQEKRRSYVQKFWCFSVLFSSQRFLMAHRRRRRQKRSKPHQICHCYTSIS